MEKMDIDKKNKDQTAQIKPQTESVIIQQKLTRANGENYVKRYQRGRVLGKGGFAKCYQVTNLESKKVSAIKVVNKQTLKKPKAKQKLITEIKIHKFLNHKNIVQFDHVFEDSQNVYILLQLCNHFTLNQMMKKRKRISELQVQYYISQIIEGVSYLNACRVIHRDLKLGNLMIGDNMEVKIGDFGLAAKLQSNSEKKKTICGTPNYIAPQILQGRGHSYEVDIWSIGVIIYALLFGRPPFQTSDVRKTYKKIKQCNFAFIEDMQISSNAKNLISKILVSDPSKRPTLQQIMQHPFMSSNKIPKNLPTSVLSTQLPRNFFDQYSCSFQGSSSTKILNSSKSIQRPQCQLQKAKSFKGISQRLLMRTSAGFNRNLLSKNQQRQDSKKEESTLKHTDATSTLKSNKPTLLSNNYFNIVKQMESMNYLNGGSKSNSNLNRNQVRESLSQTSTVFVKKWVDYSAKYGLGYLLSDGTTGIYFNDSSKMIIDPCNQKIDYVTKSDDKRPDLISFRIDQIPQSREISKKVTLMQYFRKYLNGSSGFVGGNSQFQCTYQRKSSDPVFCYVKKWFKTDDGILFRLNNKVIQVNFVDKSQVVVYAQNGMVVYTSPNHSNKGFYQLGVNQIPKGTDASKKMQKVKGMLIKLNMKQEQEKQALKHSQQNLMLSIQ